MDLLFLGIFICFSIILINFSLRRPQRYRFVRLGAFECLLALIFLNADRWFESPFDFHQLLSWSFLAGSFFLAIHAFRTIHAFGYPNGGIESTTRLIDRGAYRYVRHPLYGSLFLLGVGAFLKSVSVIGGLLLGGLAGFLYATARVEEKENMRKFGKAYETYMRDTKLFIPYVF